MKRKEFYLYSTARAKILTCFLALFSLMLGGNSYSQGPEEAAMEQSVGTTYEEWMAQIGDPGPFNASHIQSLSAKKGVETIGLVSVVIDSTLYSNSTIQADIYQFITDISNDSYDVSLHTVAGGTPEELRTLLRNEYNQAGNMVGAILIGDLPVCWYDCCGSSYLTFIEYFYMELTDTWADSDNDGLYELGDISKPEIFVGRLSASRLTYTGQSEAELLHNYFRKNHDYRIGQLILPNRTLAYGVDPFTNNAILQAGNMRKFFRDVTLDTASRDPYNYEDYLAQGYQYITISSHGGSQCHSFGSYPAVTYKDIIRIDPKANFFNLFGCENAKFIDTNNIACWYIFTPTYGLASIGETKVGGFSGDSLFFDLIANGSSIGKAFFNQISEGGPPYYLYYALLGDPTLRVVNCDPGAGDSDTDKVGDVCDNCPQDYNPNQMDADGDSLPDGCDNCAYVFNPGQEDNNSNGLGDSCDCYGINNSEWTKTFNLTSNDVLYSIEQTSGGEYLTAGKTGDSLQNAFFAKINSCGEPIWHKTLYQIGPGYSGLSTSDGGYIIGGTNGRPHLWKLDSVYNLQWRWQNRDTVGDSEAVGRCVCLTSDNNYILVGESPEKGGAFMAKVTGTGVQVSIYYYGNNGDAFYDIKPTADGNYIAAGFKINGSGRKEVYLVKVDSNLNVIWEAQPGKMADKDDRAFALTIGSDGYYYIAGSRSIPNSDTSNYIVMKVSADSHYVWTKEFNPGFNDVARAIDTAGGGGLVIAGYTNASAGQPYDAYIVKIDSGGNMVRPWRKGGTGSQKVYDISVDEDGYFVLAGESDGDFYVTHYDPTTYICGDVNSDGVVNLLDVLYLNSYKYYGGPAPMPWASGDVNCDGVINLLDILYLINYINNNGPAPCTNANCS